MPDDWQTTTLGEVADWYSGGTPRARDPKFYENGSIPWAVIADLLQDPIFETSKRITDAGLEQIGGRVAPAGSVLISMYGTIGRTSVAGVDVATNQAIAWGEVHTDCIVSNFLQLLLQSKQTFFEGVSRGAAQKNINRRIIKSTNISLPPLAEQRRIVDLVGAIDTCIDALEVQVEADRTFRAGVLAELLSGEHRLPESYDKFVEAS